MIFPVKSLLVLYKLYINVSDLVRDPHHLGEVEGGFSLRSLGNFVKAYVFLTENIVINTTSDNTNLKDTEEAVSGPKY